MKTFQIKFYDGKGRTVEADNFCPCASGVTFYVDGTASAYYADVASIEPVESIAGAENAGEVLNTAGQPAIVPQSTEVEQPPAADNVGSAS